MEVDESVPYGPTLHATSFTENEGKRRKLMTNSGNLHPHKNGVNSERAVSNFPLEYLTDEHIIKALFDVSDDELHVKIWLTYCDKPHLKSALRNIYHDHCYSDIPKLESVDFVVSPESSFTDSDDVDKIEIGCQATIELLDSSDSAKSSEKNELYNAQLHTYKVNSKRTFVR